MRYAIGLALLLAACAPTIDATELGGVATWMDSPYPTSAIAKANAHCQKYGRIARTTQIYPGGWLTFSCDRPDRS